MLSLTELARQLLGHVKHTHSVTDDQATAHLSAKMMYEDKLHYKFTINIKEPIVKCLMIN